MALTNKDIPLEQFAHKPEKLLAKINNAQAAVPGGTATRHLRDAAGSGKNREKKDERTD
jgi:hypothetical protein